MVGQDSINCSPLEGKFAQNVDDQTLALKKLIRPGTFWCCSLPCSIFILFFWVSDSSSPLFSLILMSHMSQALHPQSPGWHHLVRDSDLILMNASINRENSCQMQKWVNALWNAAISWAFRLLLPFQMMHYIALCEGDERQIQVMCSINKRGKWDEWTNVYV